ncbi:MAG: chemotaxis protein CheX [Gammaproteobacteria bacterium]|nr:chemotaxis protein CheX [Gammaproteobacteria bacterium]
MVEKARLVSKVLVHDSNPDYFDRIKIFCDNNNLIGVCAQNTNIMEVLRSNIDLGAILLSESTEDDPIGGIMLGLEIHELRPELPIFLRREKQSSLDGLDAGTQRAFATGYQIDAIDKLKPQLDEYIFSLYYPSVLVRGIQEITTDALSSQFKEVTVNTNTPYIVRDRIIHGELFSLIPIESNWCRGYLMLLSDENNMMDMVKMNKTAIQAEHADFRSMNEVFAEITNLVWGTFKARYIEDNETAKETVLTQVPIIVNQQHKYISFGTDEPQLCFKYEMHDTSDEKHQPVVLYQRFIFNLNWSPDDFKEIQTSVDDLLDSGELEFF